MKTLLSESLFATASLIFAFAVPLAAEPGELDASFNSTGSVLTSISSGKSCAARAVAIQSDGKILVAGHAGHTVGYPVDGSDFAVVRYNSNGTLDTTFNGTGKVTTDFSNDDFAESIAVQRDGRILVAGTSNSGGANVLALARYNSNGRLDTTFNGTGKVTTTVGDGLANEVCMALQADGRIVVAGSMWIGAGYDFAAVRYNSNGSLDTSFNGTGIATTPIGSGFDVAFSVAVQGDGKIIAAGYSTGLHFSLVRYNLNGSLDTTFGGTGKVITDIGTESLIYSVALQPDGRIVAAGSTWSSGSGFAAAIARYQSDGSLDTSFNSTGVVTFYLPGGYTEIHGVAIQPDGKIVAAGTHDNGTNDDIVVLRYLADGRADTSFHGTGSVVTDLTGRWESANALVVQRDGKIVVAGFATDAADVVNFAVLRYLGIATEGTARFSAPVYLASETTRSALIAVRRIEGYRGMLTVHYETADGSATAGADYTATAGVLTFGSGVRSKTFRVPLLPDTTADGGETVKLLLKSASSGRTLDTATLVLREASFGLSPTNLRPGQVLKLRGTFDPLRAAYVRFRDFAANETVVRASEVTTKSARVRVPAFIDPVTLGPGAARMTVQGEQGDRVAGPAINVPVAAPTATGEAPGAFTLEFLRVTREVCGLAERHWEAIENQSGGAVDSSTLRTSLHTMETDLATMEAELQPLVDGGVDHLDLGTIGATTLTLDSSGLSLLDRMLVAAVFEGKFKPASTGLLRSRALAERPATLTPDPIGDFHDELNPTLRDKVADILGMASKGHEMAKTHVGKAFEYAEDYLGVPGELLEPWKEAFSAANYYATVVGPSVMGMAALSMAEPFIELELHRPVTIDDYQPALDQLHQGSMEFLEDHKDRLIGKLEELLAAPDRAGTLLDFVNRFDELTDLVEQALDLEDETSVISKAFEAAATIYASRPQPTASIDDCSVTEPATGTRNAAFLVSLDRVYDLPITVTFATAPGTAGTGDYTPRNGTVTFPAGTRGKFISVAVRADSINEQPEAFTVNLTGASNATLGKATGTCTILDARRLWTVSATFTVAGSDYFLAEQFALPRAGGTRTFSLGGTASAKVTVNASAMSVSGSGFGSGGSVTCTGSGAGSGSIVEGPASISASGPISGNLHCKFDDGSTADYPITGTFSATGTK